MSLETSSDTGPSLRDHVEAAVAQHSPGPDVENVVNGAIEHRDQEHRARSREQEHRRPESGRQSELGREGATTDKRRADIRNALNDARIKAAQQGSAPQPIKAGEVPAGPPPTWDTKAKAAWESMPQEARLAALRDHAQIKPHLEQYAELDRVLAPVRDVYRQQGAKSDAEAVGTLLKWEAAIRNPATRHQAITAIMAQYQVNPHELFGGAAQQQQQPQYHPEHVASAERAITEFEGRPHFAQVRETMGLLLSAHGQRYVKADGSVNLDAVYREACKADGVSAAPQARPRAAIPSSPSSRTPAAYPDPGKRGLDGSTVRASLRAAFKANSGRV